MRIRRAKEHHRVACGPFEYRQAACGRQLDCAPADVMSSASLLRYRGRKNPLLMSPKTLRRAKAPKKAKILRSKFIYKGPIFGVRRDEVLEPNGVRATREVITHPGSVVVLPVLPDGRIVLIRQYRHATRLFMWDGSVTKTRRTSACGRALRARWDG